MISFTKRRVISLTLCLSIAFSASMTQSWFGFFKKKKPQSKFAVLKSKVSHFSSSYPVISKVSIGFLGACILGAMAYWFSGYFGSRNSPGPGSNSGGSGKLSTPSQPVKKGVKDKKTNANGVEKLPIVGGGEYDIKFLGFEKLHPFDSTKYGKVERFLVNELGISKNRFVEPRMVTNQELLTVHTQRYLDSLRNSSVVQRVTEVPGINWVPNFLLRRYILNPMKLATGGTIQAVQLALQHGWSINLGGGYHHAKTNEGGGFCFYADIPIAVKKLWQTNPNLRVMVIDLDAHQGNGHEQVFGNDHRVKIFDMYNRDAYPRDERAKRHIAFDVPVGRGINGDRYIQILRQRLDSALNQLEQQNQKPDLIIFNAGTDPLDDDPLGDMRVSEEKMIERDDIVFEQAKRRRIPITYLFSGGYTSQSSLLIGRSLENVLRKHLRVRSGRKVNNVPKLFE